jgi:hypothetical protein
MPLDASSSRTNSAAVGEKVAKLSAFIAADLDARTPHGLHSTSCYLLIARSPRSPVAQAVRANAARLAAANVTVRAIFCEAPITDTQSEAFALPGECRIARDARLLDAHEQLVLAPDRSWIGDCMRREPTKRDTYERFSENSAESAAFATRAFERLWRSSAAMRSIPTMPAAFASRLPGVANTPFAEPDSFRRQ